MGILFSKADINAGMEQYQKEARAVLVDVREPDEHAFRRIPGSRNVPLGEIGKIKFVVSDLSTPVYLYCENGNRSRSALSTLKKLGYTAAYDIGGIKGYRGKTEGGPK